MQSVALRAEAIPATRRIIPARRMEEALTGKVNTEEILNGLPQVFAGQGQHHSFSATGIATVDMRHLGPSRTLVLINGRRLMPGDPQQPVADLNTVPSALIKRVDVVTGGVSSVYGADAVAGVVNFIMDTAFEGIRLDLNDSFYWDNNNNAAMQGLIDARFGAGTAPKGSITDGVQRGVALTMGGSFAGGKGHMTAYFSYQESHPVQQNSRDYSYCAANVSGGALVCGGSSNAYPTNYLVDGVTFGVDADGNRVAPSLYNYAALSYQQRDGVRYAGGVFGNYEIDEHFKPYIEFMMTDDDSHAQFGPSGAFALAVTVPCAGDAASGWTSDNPLVPEAVLNAACPLADEIGNTTVRIRRRNVEGGGRINDFRHTAYRFVAGMKGKIDGNWSYDIYGQYGKTVYQQVLSNYLSNSRMRRALEAIADPNDPAKVICAAGNSGGCVPWNVWQNNPSPESLAYVAVNPIFNGGTREYIVNGSITGNLGAYGVKMPWTNEGIGIAFGAEYRKERLISQPDSAFSSGDVAGLIANPSPLDVSLNVKEVFGEMHVPVAEEMPFAHSIAFDASYRYSDYSVSGTTHAYKFGFNWAPVKAFNIRASYNRAIRSPNLLELYQSPGYGLWSGVDPCAGTSPKLTEEQCARTGVPDGRYGRIEFGTAAQYDSYVGGNPNLKPEKSDTWSAGFIFQPEGMLHGLAITADWFSINIKKYIQAGLSASFVINQCAAGTGPAEDDPFCKLIHRNSTGGFNNGNGTDGVEQYWLNTGKLRVSGVDVSASYNLDLGTVGKLNFDLNGTWMDKYISTPLEGVDQKFDCAGYYGSVCQVPIPKWRHALRVTWDTPWNVQASANWRYQGPVTNDALNANPVLQHPNTIAASDRRIKAFNYFDLAAAWDVTKGFTVRGGIRNVFDKRPPVISTEAVDATYANGNTYPGVYDPLGRAVYFSATVKF